MNFQYSLSLSLKSKTEFYAITIKKIRSQFQTLFLI